MFFGRLEVLKQPQGVGAFRFKRPGVDHALRLPLGGFGLAQPRQEKRPARSDRRHARGFGVELDEAVGQIQAAPVQVEAPAGVDRHGQSGVFSVDVMEIIVEHRFEIQPYIDVLFARCFYEKIRWCPEKCAVKLNNAKVNIKKS